MSNNSGPDGTNTSEDETYDPVVAERFELLNRATPPTAVVSPLAGHSADSPSGSDRRRFVLATAATAALLVAAVAAFVVAGRDDSVEVAGDVDSSEETTDESAQDAVPTTESPGDSDSTTTTAMLVSTETLEAPSSAETSPGETSVPTVPPQTSETAGTGNTTIPKTTDPETTVPVDGDVVTIRGVVTEVMLDCNSHLVLGDNGEVKQSDAIMCDGGNFIVVDGTQISTTSGYVPADMAFNNHPDWLKPGLRVTVTAFREGAGWLHLNCDQCQVRRG